MSGNGTGADEIEAPELFEPSGPLRGEPKRWREVGFAPAVTLRRPSL